MTHDENRESNDQELLQLEAMKGHIDRLVVPAGIESAIRSGIRLGRRRRQHRMIMRMTSFTMCLLLIASVVSIRFSPVVAAYVGDIPGLRSLVELIHYDKGLKLALENDFMQPVGLSEEYDGIKLTVDGIVVDESRMIVFYTLTNTDGRKRVINLRNVNLVNNDGGSSSYGSSDFSENWDSKQGTIDFTWQEGNVIPDTLDLEIKLGKDNETAALNDVWRFVIPVNKIKFEGMKETYDINQAVVVEDQQITFGQMTIYPTRIALEVDYNPTNTKKLFSFDDIRIEDENGESFGTIMNGVSGSIVDENRLVLYFQSNYFRKPEQLFLRASSIRALDKSKLEVQVDLDSKQLLSRPDERLTLEHWGISEESDQEVLAFRLKNDDQMDQHFQYHLFSSNYKDASGQSFDSNRTGSSPNEFQYYLKETDYSSPITLTVSDYPSRIYGDINLRIK